MKEPDPNWHELRWICRHLHHLLYRRGDAVEAMKYQARLEELAAELPVEVEAILHAEALALVHELRGEWAEALARREQEMAMMNKLMESLRQDGASPETLRYALQDRGPLDYEARQEIAQELRRRLGTE
ncbi:MAG: hypothetical protein H6828_06845 [Planctomycetes bacterium]|nr:hypothetical protein [Planctomycetota bacterium]